MIKYIGLVISLLLLCGTTIAQSKIEFNLSKAEEIFKENPEEARKYSSEALRIALQDGDSLQITRCYMQIGREYLDKGNFDKSFLNYYTAEIFAPQSAYKEEAIINTIMTRFYLLVKDFDKAFEHIDSAFRFAEMTSDSATIAKVYNMRGLAYTNMEENELAEREFYRALSINERIGNMDGMVSNYNNLGLYKSQDTEHKIELLLKAIEYNISKNNNWSLGENYNNLGTQYLYKGDFRSALKYLNIARSYAKKVDAQELLCDNYRYTYWTYDSLKNYNAAFDNFEKMYELEQKIITERFLVEQELGNVIGNLELKTQEAVTKLEIQTISTQRYYYMFFSVALLLIVVIGIMFIVIRRWHEKVQRKDQEIRRQEQEKEIAQSSIENIRQEMVGLSFYIRSKMNLLNKVKELLREIIKGGEQQDTRQGVKMVVSFITANQSKDEQIDLLNTKIDEVCGSFTKKLKSLYPELTVGELQLAAFIRINMSSKEISLLTGTSEKSINMGRYRLRKHLSLSTDVNLYEFLIKI